MTTEQAAEELQSMFRANAKYLGYPEVKVIPLNGNIQIRRHDDSVMVYPYEGYDPLRCLLHLGFKARNFVAEKVMIERELHHAEQYKILIGGLIQIAEKVAAHLEGSDQEDMKQAISEFREKARSAGVEV